MHCKETKYDVPKDAINRTSEKCFQGGGIMILAIDVGNTNIVIGCMEEDRVLFT